MSGTPASLARPSALSLSRVSDRLSFLYLDKCRVEQDDNGTHARIETADGDGRVSVKTTYLPTATLSCLMLGPGVSITTPALTAMARNGCTVVIVGSGGVRCYSTVTPLSGSTVLLNAQAKASVTPALRIELARKMLLRRFPDDVIPQDSSMTLERLRGLEGARMKAFYRLHANRHRLKNWRRRHSASDGLPLDPVNEAMNFANTALYGVTAAVVGALGLSPGLGIVHEGSPKAFVLDIADLYKTEVTIPLAFKQAKSTDPGRDVMFALREEFRLLKLIPRIVDDIHYLLGEQHEDPDWKVDDLFLWQSDGQHIASGWNQDDAAGQPK